MKHESPRSEPQRPIGGFRLPTVNPDTGDYRVGPRDASSGHCGLIAVYLPLCRAIGVSHTGSGYANVPYGYSALSRLNRASATSASASRSAMAAGSPMWKPCRPPLAV